MASEVGNGSHTLFWTDRWLHGNSIVELAPRLVAAVSGRRRKTRTVQQALTDRTWISDITGALTVGVILEYLQLWDLIQDIVLQPEIEDTHIWRLSPSGKYSAKSAYMSLFGGATLFGPWERIWHSWAPLKCHFFLWLVAHKWCWMADRLARHGLPHPEVCPLCDQAEESIDHLLVQCVLPDSFGSTYYVRSGCRFLRPNRTRSPLMHGGRNLTWQQQVWFRMTSILPLCWELGLSGCTVTVVSLMDKYQTWLEL
ncbi:hypothetical protein PR202_gb20476 [Eleusine coracana subsp. coracana]|uniref:Reverse transcriptase zinc-binding domain-containing protein n=1 Tax=Eleusine coracana subsp. coracana TaxID=191504 RepID=A0AAV5F8M0_ELECO|nr:hypothetical protein PR202_gb20476 [Eleusine coracana subsp. coracana]